MILALDLGTKLGWAVGKNRWVEDHGVINLINKKTKWFDKESFIAFEDFLKSKQHKHNVDLIIVEKPHVSPYYHSNRVLFGLMGVASTFCPIDTASPKALKKFITGDGTASKEQMVEHLIKKHPNIVDHNNADALALFYYYWAIMYKEE